MGPGNVFGVFSSGSACGAVVFDNINDPRAKALSTAIKTAIIDKRSPEVQEINRENKVDVYLNSHIVVDLISAGVTLRAMVKSSSAFFRTTEDKTEEMTAKAIAAAIENFTPEDGRAIAKAAFDVRGVDVSLIDAAIDAAKAAEAKTATDIKEKLESNSGYIISIRRCNDRAVSLGDPPPYEETIRDLLATEAVFKARRKLAADKIVADEDTIENLGGASMIGFFDSPCLGENNVFVVINVIAVARTVAYHPERTTRYISKKCQVFIRNHLIPGEAVEDVADAISKAVVAEDFAKAANVAAANDEVRFKTIIDARKSSDTDVRRTVNDTLNATASAIDEAAVKTIADAIVMAAAADFLTRKVVSREHVCRY